MEATYAHRFKQHHDGSIAATTLNTSGAIVSTGKVTVNNVLAITGYADVKLAIDGKQPTLTGSSNITTEHQSIETTASVY
jgi:hypothetical protein